MFCNARYSTNAVRRAAKGIVKDYVPFYLPSIDRVRYERSPAWQSHECLWRRTKNDPDLSPRPKYRRTYIERSTDVLQMVTKPPKAARETMVTKPHTADAPRTIHDMVTKPPKARTRWLESRNARHRVGYLVASLQIFLFSLNGERVQWKSASAVAWNKFTPLLSKSTVA